MTKPKVTQAGARTPRTAQATAELRTREHEALSLALAGASYDEIAERCGYTNRGAAWKAVQRLLSRQAAADADELRDVEGARLDRLQTAHWPAALRGDVKASALILRIMERRARLFGLDAPAKFELTESAEVDATLTALAAELAEMPGPAALPDN